MLKQKLNKQQTNCYQNSKSKQLIQALKKGALLELELTPKPGLVDSLNNGSHLDLNFSIMHQSIELLDTYFKEIADHTHAGEKLSTLKTIGLCAEKRMLDQCGTNTHKGYIFLSGLVLIASTRYDDLRQGISLISKSLFDVKRDFTNGNLVRNTFQTGGIIDECLNGLPTIFDTALPVFQEKLKVTNCFTTASYYLMAVLMQYTEDTTAYHRCGIDGIKQIRKDGIRLQQLLDSGRNVTSWLINKNRQYQKMNLTMGGVADLIALTFALNEAGLSS